MSRLKHKKGRKSNYVKSLNNDYDREVRRRVLIRDDFKCKLCGSASFLEKHHITYYIDNKSIVGCELEFLYALVMLCSTCHQVVHNDKGHMYNPNNYNKEYVK